MKFRHLSPTETETRRPLDLDLYPSNATEIRVPFLGAPIGFEKTFAKMMLGCFRVLTILSTPIVSVIVPISSTAFTGKLEFILFMYQLLH